MSVFSGLSRPLKAAGVALVAVAVVAAVIGGITVLNSGSSSDTAAPSGSPQAPSSPVVPPSGSPTLPPTSPVPPSTTPPSSPVPPSTTPGGEQPGQTGQPGQPGNGQQSAKWVVVRVYNNSLINGLAARAKKDFEASGWKVEDPKPYPYGTIPTTTAYYRPGTDEETAAKALAAEFGMKAEQRFEGIQDSSPGVIVILTKDYKGAETKGS